jgi:hypothetical protein
MCAFYTTRVYEGYNTYITEVMDDILRAENFDEYYMQ